jgi:hypothetical protein
MIGKAARIKKIKCEYKKKYFLLHKLIFQRIKIVSERRLTPTLVLPLSITGNHEM